MVLVGFTSFRLKLIGLAVSLCGVMGLSGCGTSIEPLMPTPALFSETGVGPLDHIPEAERWNPRRVYYVTTRERDDDLQRIDYTNGESSNASVGMALIGFGGDEMTWEDLNHASKSAERERVVPLSIAGLLESGRFTPEPGGGASEVTGGVKWLASWINDDIEDSRDKDIFVYVHGAKVNFYNACAFTAQIDHFMGRDMTSLAFSWPSRQSIITYGIGKDLARSYRAAPALASTLSMLAEHTNARKINILAWSAGGRILTSALTDLRARHPDATPEELREKYRLGTVYFAAADVPRDEFLDALPGINDMVDRVVVTGSSADKTLQQGRFFMGGEQRIGEIGTPLTEEQRDVVLAADRLEYVNLSMGSEERGFDITGHRYWFNHPWASSDVILSIRSDLSPDQRGLQKTENDALWSMPNDYPERLKKSLSQPDLSLRE